LGNGAFSGVASPNSAASVWIHGAMEFMLSNCSSSYIIQRSEEVEAGELFYFVDGGCM
jgi:hypothetical protein